MPIKKGDFAEVDFVGRVKESQEIFDLTEEKVARENGIFNERHKYEPLIICIGERHIVKGVDDFLVGKDVGDYKVEVSVEDGFGKKNPKLMKIVSTSVFRKDEIRPFPGLQVSIDGMLGTIRTVSGGRVIVDFNHPLAGHDLTYEIKIRRIVMDAKEKLSGLMRLIANRDVEVSANDGKAEVKLEIKDVEFLKKREEGGKREGGESVNH